MTNGPSLLTDAALLDAVRRLAALEHHSAADLVEHFVELDARRLYLGEGFSSLFGYCREVCVFQRTAPATTSRPPARRAPFRSSCPCSGMAF